jgi:hypothetical protein
MAQDHQRNFFMIIQPTRSPVKRRKRLTPKPDQRHSSQRRKLWYKENERTSEQQNVAPKEHIIKTARVHREPSAEE